MTISTDTTLLHDPRRQASLLYWQGFSVPQIAEMLQVKRPTVQSWKQRDGWDGIAPISRVESSLEARLIQLIAKPQKSGGDFKEIDLLGRQIAVLPTASKSTSVTARSPVASSAMMASGGRLSLLRTPLPVAAPCSTSTSSNEKTVMRTLRTCLCASLSTIKRRYSRSRSCSAAWST